MELSSIFTSNAVFPANNPIRIFGVGSGKCEIEFAGIKKKAESSEETWCVEFPAMEYGGPYTLEVVLNGEKITLSDIYIGEVYLFAGQSNMQFKLKMSNTPEEMYVSDNRIRFTPIIN